MPSRILVRSLHVHGARGAAACAPGSATWHGVHMAPWNPTDSTSETPAHEWPVLIPKDAGVSRIVPGSGIVCKPGREPGEVIVDFEGNLYQAAGLSRYADRVWHAVGRAQVSYPTVARIHVQLSEFVVVGFFDELWGRVELDPGCLRLVADWLGVSEGDLAGELETSGVEHSTRRELAAYARTHRAEARFLVANGPGNIRRAGEAIGLR